MQMELDGTRASSPAVSSSGEDARVPNMRQMQIIKECFVMADTTLLLFQRFLKK